MALLSVEGVSKRFGSLSVLKDLSLSVEEGSVYGFIGKNGAGKTTTMKLVLGLLRPDAGEIILCGKQVRYGDTATNRLVGYLPDVPEFYGYMTPAEYLYLCGEVAGLERAEYVARSKELLGLVGLETGHRKIRGFSRGMKQRLGIAQALLGRPKLLICDEPTSALDPIGRKEILDILSRVKGETTVLFSTHILSDVERVCDTVGVLNGGKLLLQGGLEEIKSLYRTGAVQVELAKEQPALQSALAKLPFVRSVEVSGALLTLGLTSPEAGAELLSFLGQQQVPVLRYEVAEPTLEHLFLEVVQ